MEPREPAVQQLGEAPDERRRPARRAGSRRREQLEEGFVSFEFTRASWEAIEQAHHWTAPGQLVPRRRDPAELAGGLHDHHRREPALRSQGSNKARYFIAFSPRKSMFQLIGAKKKQGGFCSMRDVSIERGLVMRDNRHNLRGEAVKAGEKSGSLSDHCALSLDWKCRKSGTALFLHRSQIIWKNFGVRRSYKSRETFLFFSARKSWCWPRTGSTGSRPTSSTAWAAARSAWSCTTCPSTSSSRPCRNRCPSSSRSTPRCSCRTAWTARSSSSARRTSSCKWCATSPSKRARRRRGPPRRPRRRSPRRRTATTGAGTTAARSYRAARSCCASSCSPSRRYAKDSPRSGARSTRRSKVSASTGSSARPTRISCIFTMPFRYSLIEFSSFPALVHSITPEQTFVLKSLSWRAPLLARQVSDLE